MTSIAAGAREFRAFNRFYTSAIGILTDRYLGRDRPLAESRLLFEIGWSGAAVRDLRARLDLDAGYVTRLLKSLQAQGLVQVSSAPGDGRARVAELTPAGQAELAELDERSDAVAAGLLQRLTPSQRDGLLAALAVVRRQLRLAAITIEVADPNLAEARQCLEAYADELGRRFPAGFNRADLVPAGQVSGVSGAFLLARERAIPVGCALVRTMAPGIGEIRHVWVHAEARRLGLGRRLLAELELEAAGRGLLTLRLDTNEVLTEAISMYRGAGYHEIPRYDDSPYAHYWFEKHLQPAARAATAGPRP